MNFEAIKANLNLYAVLQNLEDLVRLDLDMTSLTQNWNVSIQFSVFNGPQAYIAFTNGRCSVKKGKCKSPSVILFFLSPGHLNKMMDGKGNPIPLRGFTKLSFLTKEFPKLTDKLDYYLKPNDTLLSDQAYLKLNTRFTLNTAAFAVRELAFHDTIGKLNAAHIRDGKVLFKVLPDGPCAYLHFHKGNIDVHKEDTDKPMAMMSFKNSQVANDLLNDKIDAFTAVAMGDVIMNGQVSMIEPINIILDRVSFYLS